jgi:hypothetical protein
MFAKSKQIGLVSILVVLGAMIGGCAESVGNEPASFANVSHPAAFLARTPPAPTVNEESFRVARSEPAAAPIANKHAAAARPVARVH